MDYELANARKDKILSFIQDKAYTPMTGTDMAYLLEVPLQDRDTLQQILQELIRDGKIVITKKGKIMSPSAMGLVAGAFIGNARGFGFVAAEGLAQDIFIPPTHTNGAMHKDKVLCRLLTQAGNSRRAEGEIVQILARGINTIIGAFAPGKRGAGFVLPDDPKLSHDIYIPSGRTKGAVEGHKVAAKITKPAQEGQNPEGIITEILGHQNDPGVDILSIIMRHEIPTDYPPKVYKETEHIPDSVSPEDLEGRRDLRETLMVTIDGEDAKDLDDAVSLEILPGGIYRLGVHIADVSHYVREGGALDEEALKRGTSVYLVDRVLPMLPHKLSNGICSLNPQVDRLALSCIMDIDEKGKVLAHEICQSVIHTNRRMTYTAVNDILHDRHPDGGDIEEILTAMFKNMGKLGDILRERRMKRGAIEFGFAECKIIIDEKGKPTDIKPYIRNRATSLIEEFMLICNETIAEQYHWLELPFVFRTHEEPDPEKIQALSDFIHKLGYHLKGGGAHPKAIQKLLANVENTPEEMIIGRVALRSLKQARYTVTNDGHFGLAAQYYCHFTSPIRRYPDLQIHRIIKAHLNGTLTEKDIARLQRLLPEVCRLCSLNERTAEYAERDVENMKKAEYMSDKIGQTFTGLISSVTSWGLYVELPNTVEGMISAGDLTGDYFRYDEANLRYIGEHTRKTYSLGDKVNVVLTRVNVPEGKLDFELC